MYANPQQHIDCEDFRSRGNEHPYDPGAPQHRQYFQKQQAQLPDNLKVLRVLDREFPNRGKLLEIGSFAGLFLERIRADGWETTGLEPNRPPARYARERYGLNIVDGVLPNSNLPAACFDAVVMLHVIEHMPDPAGSLREIRRVLKPGGALALETPRFDSLMFKLLGHRERSIQNCPGHIYFFTGATLCSLLERNGFSIFQVEHVGRTLTLERFLYNVGLVTRSLALQRWFEEAGRALRLDKVRFHINVRDMQRMFARAV